MTSDRFCVFIRAPYRLPLSCISIAMFMIGYASAQQSTDTQMPQAPRAPSIDTLNNSSAPDNASDSIAPELGGRLSLNLMEANGQDDDNDDETRRDTVEIEAQLQLDLEQRLSRFSRLTARMELAARQFSVESLNEDNDDFTYDLERLYFQLDPNKSFRFRLGRQPIDDLMHTIIDEDLDGLRVTYDAGITRFDLSHTREDWFEASSDKRSDSVKNMMGSIRLSPNKNSRWMPYILHRSSEAFLPEGEDKESDAYEKTWFGIQGIVQPDNSPVRYWVHGSAQTGEEFDNEGPDKKLGGYLLDLGINWTLQNRFKPTLTFAAAYATGGDGDDEDERFRQSDLHGNDFALNTKNSFRYLGEVLDPELTNIQVLTVGLGIELGKRWSADTALHHYQQVVVSDNLRGSDIAFDPAGENDDLGLGGEVVVAYEPIKSLDIKGTAGFFEPGDAFHVSQNDTAWLLQLEVDYSF